MYGFYKQIVHGDLATRNVLLDANEVAKIADFGLSKRIYNYKEYVKQNLELLPWCWMAPECLRRGMFNEKTDVWAFGVTLWEIYTLGDQPYDGMQFVPNFSSLLEEGLRLCKPKYSNKEICDLITQCWDFKPQMRPSFSDLENILRGMNNCSG